MDYIKNKYLAQWINENYPEMVEIDLSYVDIDNFAFWMQDKIHNEAMREAHGQFQDVCKQHGFR